MPGVAPYARAAYAQGWAASGGPMTDRVQAGCVAAICWAEENEDRPDVLEVSLKLGSLEGVWAIIYRRRDALIAKHAALVQKAWNDTLRTLDVGRAVQHYRRATGLSEAAWTIVALRQAAREAMVSLLSWLPGTVTWQSLRTAFGAGIAAAVAEGKVGALALAWENTGRTTLDFDLAFTHAYDALSSLGQVWTSTDDWLGRMLDRQTDQLGSALGALASEGASYEEMVSAAEAILTGADGDAVEFIVDWALNTALSQGALDLYRSEGIQQITFMTAGDDRVCPICEQAESDSPFSPADLPTPPLHPRCRCTIAAELSLPGSLEQYLTAQ